MPKKYNSNDYNKDHVEIPDFLKPSVGEPIHSAAKKVEPSSKKAESTPKKKEPTSQKTDKKAKQKKEQKLDSSAKKTTSIKKKNNTKQNTKDMEQEDKKPAIKRALNKQILAVAYFFVIIFVCLIVYFAKYIAIDSKDDITSAYNKRQNSFMDKVVKGDILSCDKEVLATTLKTQNGKEKRDYPYGNMFSHVVGFNSKGRSGLESSENFNLYSTSASMWEQMVNDIKEVKSDGDSIVTTLDVDVQKAAYNALGNNKGAVVAMEPATGKILAMVSKPDYNPNDINDIWDSLSKDEDSALLNRATQGLYPPGSTFKVLTALEYIREHPDYEEYSYTCNGTNVEHGVNIHCAGNEVHGKVNLAKSLAYSCNTSFVNIGESLNFGKYQNLCESFLFNQTVPFNFECSVSKFSLNKNSDPSEMPQTAIGQGDTLITPLENALIMSTIANGGVMMKPMLVTAVLDSEKEEVNEYAPSVLKEVMTSKEAQTMTDLLTDVVESGTASALSGLRHSYAGKTGSAENSEGSKTHAWFIAFSPTDNPKLVVSVIVENVGGGSTYAVPVAQAVYQAYYDKYEYNK